VTEDERKAERRAVSAFLSGNDGAVGKAIVEHLRFTFGHRGPDETKQQMLTRLGRLDAVADIERLWEDAMQARRTP
jgi:hypothetical protein